MNVFVSWSGPRSRAMARAVVKWMPSVLSGVEMWQSDLGIAAGDRGLSRLAAQLEQSHVGIICLTPENVCAPWLLFEAGAISKSLESGHVIPLLLDVEVADLPAALQQFQAKKADRDGMAEVVGAINRLRAKPHTRRTIHQRLEERWPALDATLQEIRLGKAAGSPAFDQVILRRSEVGWSAFNRSVSSRFWVCGTSLAALCDRQLMRQFIDQGARDVRLLVPDTSPEPSKCSLMQLREFDRVGKLGRQQVRDASDCRKKLREHVRQLLGSGKLSGPLDRYFRCYRGTMYPNITISDTQAYLAYYGLTGSGDDAITLFADRRKNEDGYERIVCEFEAMWAADASWGLVPRPRAGR